MRRSVGLILCGVICAVVLSGCGVVLPYAYDATKLDDRLSRSMPKADVQKALGKPNRIVWADDHVTIWEYRLYPKHEWFGYLIHCPWHPFCYFPAEPPHPHYVAFWNDRVCVWGSPTLVGNVDERVCSEPRSADTGLRWTRQPSIRPSVVPVFMPPRVAVPIHRLAVIGSSETQEAPVTSWLDLTLNFMRSRHPDLVLVEREDVKRLFDEVEWQHTGRVDDATMVHVGKYAGADALLMYRMITADSDAGASASLDLRLLSVETGMTLFRQHTTATARPDGLRSLQSPTLGRVTHRAAVEQASAYGFASLAAAFGDNPLGIVPDYGWTGRGVRVLGVLEGGPAALAGLKEGDRIVSADGSPVRSWTELQVMPAMLRIERATDRIEVQITRR